MANTMLHTNSSQHLNFQPLKHKQKKTPSLAIERCFLGFWWQNSNYKFFSMAQFQPSNCPSACLPACLPAILPICCLHTRWHWHFCWHYTWRSLFFSHWTFYMTFDNITRVRYVQKFDSLDSGRHTCKQTHFIYNIIIAKACGVVYDRLCVTL